MSERTCSEDGCDGERLARGLCSKHYQRLRDHGPDFVPRPKPDPDRKCSVEGCSNGSKLKGMCPKHYYRMRRHGTTGDPVPKAAGECRVEGCDEFVKARELCSLHLTRYYRTGSTDPSPIDPVKRCVRCKRSLPRAAFPNRKRRICEECFPLYQQEQRAKQMNPHRARGHDVAALLKAQDNRCAICGCRAEDAPRKRLCLDHDHATNGIRGMLCIQCNSGLGQFKDDPARMLAAIAYLERTGSVQKVRQLPRRKRDLAAAGRKSLEDAQPLAEVVTLF